jgi:hypothetical protein
VCKEKPPDRLGEIAKCNIDRKPSKTHADVDISDLSDQAELDGSGQLTKVVAEAVDGHDADCAEIVCVAAVG